MIRKASYVTLVALPVAVIGVMTLKYQLPIGPIVLCLGAIPLLGLLLARRSLAGAVPDLVFGAIDTGLLTIPALWGGVLFGVAGAIAGGVIGDALTDAIAGFFEGSIAERLRKRGIEESREAVTTALGKMSGCLVGSGVVLSVALVLGIKPDFG
jgi:prepilin signal peptidase PulO-like enzyme (type II secretory pathway)